MSLAFEVCAGMLAEPDQLYSAWLNREEHANMTGSYGNVSKMIGGDIYSQGWLC
jgi:hypothetical protein